MSSNVGLFPGLGLALGGGLSLGEERWQLEVAVLAWLNARDPGGQVEFTLTSAVVRGCRHFKTTKVTLGPCAVVEAGALSARGVSLAEGREGVVGWVAVLAGAHVLFDALSLVRPWIAIDVGLNLIRPVFALQSAGVYEAIHRVGFPIGRLTAGLEVSWK